MTRPEKEKAESLIDEALRKYKNSHYDWELYEKFKSEDNSVEAEIHLRKFQNAISCAEGIYQALAVLGFDHPKMKEFSELLQKGNPVAKPGERRKNEIREILTAGRDYQRKTGIRKVA